jgi:hypothetical protein
MADVLTLALVAALGAGSAVVGGLTLKGVHSLMGIHVARNKAREARKMPRDTEPAQAAGATVTIHGVGIQEVSSEISTGVANTELPAPIKGYSAAPVLISPKVQVSDSTHRP